MEQRLVCVDTVEVARLLHGDDVVEGEAEGMEPHVGRELELKGTPAWIEVEIIPPDGRRMFGVR